MWIINKKYNHGDEETAAYDTAHLDKNTFNKKIKLKLNPRGHLNITHNNVDGKINKRSRYLSGFAKKLSKNYSSENFHSENATSNIQNYKTKSSSDFCISELNEKENGKTDKMTTNSSEVSNLQYQNNLIVLGKLLEERKKKEDLLYQRAPEYITTSIIEETQVTSECFEKFNDCLTNKARISKYNNKLIPIKSYELISSLIETELMPIEQANDIPLNLCLFLSENFSLISTLSYFYCFILVCKHESKQTLEQPIVCKNFNFVIQDDSSVKCIKTHQRITRFKKLRCVKPLSEMDYDKIGPLEASFSQAIFQFKNCHLKAQLSDLENIISLKSPSKYLHESKDFEFSLTGDISHECDIINELSHMNRNMLTKNELNTSMQNDSQELGDSNTLCKRRVKYIPIKLQEPVTTLALRPYYSSDICKTEFYQNSNALHTTRNQIEENVLNHNCKANKSPVLNYSVLDNKRDSNSRKGKLYTFKGNQIVLQADSKSNEIVRCSVSIPTSSNNSNRSGTDVDFESNTMVNLHLKMSQKDIDIGCSVFKFMELTIPGFTAVLASSESDSLALKQTSAHNAAEKKVDLPCGCKVKVSVFKAAMNENFARNPGDPKYDILNHHYEKIIKDLKKKKLIQEHDFQNYMKMKKFAQDKKQEKQRQDYETQRIENLKKEQKNVFVRKRASFVNSTGSVKKEEKEDKGKLLQEYYNSYRQKQAEKFASSDLYAKLLDKQKRAKDTLDGPGFLIPRAGYQKIRKEGFENATDDDPEAWEYIECEDINEGKSAMKKMSNRLAAMLGIAPDSFMRDKTDATKIQPSKFGYKNKNIIINKEEINKAITYSKTFETHEAEDRNYEFSLSRAKNYVPLACINAEEAEKGFKECEIYEIQNKILAETEVKDTKDFCEIGGKMYHVHVTQDHVSDTASIVTNESLITLLAEKRDGVPATSFFKKLKRRFYNFYEDMRNDYDQIGFEKTADPAKLVQLYDFTTIDEPGHFKPLGQEFRKLKQLQEHILFPGELIESANKSNVFEEGSFNVHADSYLYDSEAFIKVASTYNTTAHNKNVTQDKVSVYISQQHKSSTEESSECQSTMENGMSVPVIQILNDYTYLKNTSAEDKKAENCLQISKNPEIIRSTSSYSDQYWYHQTDNHAKKNFCKTDSNTDSPPCDCVLNDPLCCNDDKEPRCSCKSKKTLGEDTCGNKLCECQMFAAFEKKLAQKKDDKRKETASAIERAKGCNTNSAINLVPSRISKVIRLNKPHESGKMMDQEQLESYTENIDQSMIVSCSSTAEQRGALNSVDRVVMHTSLSRRSNRARLTQSTMLLLDGEEKCLSKPKHVRVASSQAQSLRSQSPMDKEVLSRTRFVVRPRETIKSPPRMLRSRKCRQPSLPSMVTPTRVTHKEDSRRSLDDDRIILSSMNKSLPKIYIKGSRKSGCMINISKGS